MTKVKRRNRFNSRTGTNANLMRQIKRLEEKNRNLEQENKRLSFMNLQLLQRIAELENLSSEFFDTLNNSENISLILKSYIDILQKNITRKPKGYRYKGLKEYFTLLSFMGPHYYGILNSHMLFPSYRRTLDYKKYFLDMYQITDDLFSGSIENVTRIMQIFLPPEFNGKAVIMIDATSVTPYVQVDENGIVEGLLDCKCVPVNEAKELIDNDNEFCKFINLHSNFLIQAEFGISIAPLDPNYQSFPIACLQATSGKATYEIVEFIEILIAQLRNSINIVGLGTDGDNSYRKYSREFMANLMADLNSFLSMNILEITDKISVLMHFSDPLHLVKRDRYRKSSAEDFCVSPLLLDCTRNSKDLKNIGVPPYLLDDNKGRKMEDDLPKKLFSLLYIQKIMESGDFNLLISMLPSTLLMQSLYSTNLSRQATIDHLLLGASIVLIYYIMSQYVSNGTDENLNSRINEHKKKICFNYDWCEEYIFTTICIAVLLYTEEIIDVGACGSHYQEHNFANVKRHSNKDNTHTRFMKSMKYILLEKLLYRQLSIDEFVPNSRSDSGRTISDDTNVIIRPFGFYFYHAKRLWSNITSFPKDSILSQIDQNEPPMSMLELTVFLGGFSEKIKHSISTKSSGMIRTGGLNNAKIWNAIEQMEDLLDGDEYD